MTKALRKLLRLAFLAGVTAALVAGARAAIGRLSGDPGAPSRAPGGSFDSWPAVPSAPSRNSETV